MSAESVSRLNVARRHHDQGTLTADERGLLRWILENGDEHARQLVEQVDRAQVVSRCGCGCATIDLSVDGVEADRSHGMEQVGEEYFWKGPTGGVCATFVLGAGDQLATLELYSADGIDTPVSLPSTDQLQREPWF